MLLLTRNDLALPIKDPAELHDICVAQFDQLLRSLFTAAAAAAVDHNKLLCSLWNYSENIPQIRKLIPDGIRSIIVHNNQCFATIYNHKICCP